MKKTTDRHADYKLVFMKIADDCIKNNTPKRQGELYKIVTETLQKDPELLMWFNTMFHWRNTEHGVEINYRIKTPKIPDS